VRGSEGPGHEGEGLSERHGSPHVNKQGEGLKSSTSSQRRTSTFGAPPLFLKPGFAGAYTVWEREKAEQCSFSHKQFGNNTRFPEEQASIVQSLSKDVNTVKKLVALRVEGDQCAFQGCAILGHQDSLYTHSLRQFYKDCTIAGTVDFIFGNSAAVFQTCKIVVRVRDIIVGFGPRSVVGSHAMLGALRGLKISTRVGFFLVGRQAGVTSA
jgi:hypothetical protein